MYCRNCGREIPDNSLYCPECGANQKPIPQAGQQTEETKVWGVLSIVFAAIPALVLLGIIFGVIGLCTYKQKENQKLCWIGIGIAIAWVVLVVILWLIAFAASISLL